MVRILEEIVHHVTHLDVACLISLVAVILHEVAALVALLESRLCCIAMDCHGYGAYRQQQLVLSSLFLLFLPDEQLALLIDDGLGCFSHVTFPFGKHFLDECTAGVGGIALADNEEIMTGTGESHIQQIEVVNAVLQMFVGIVFLIDGVSQAGTVINGHEWEPAERFFLRLAPDGISHTHLHCPVAEGYDDIVELESL